MEVQPQAVEDELLSLALCLQEKWLGSHESNSLLSRDVFDATRFDQVFASLWDKRGALEERHTASSSREVAAPSALVMSANASPSDDQSFGAVQVARRLRCYSQFRQALETLEHLNSHDTSVVLEQAKIYFEQGDRWSLLRISENALARAAETGHNGDNDAICAVFTLYISLARIDLLTEEMLVRSEAELRRFVDKWVPNRVEGTFWTEVQVLIQQLYYTFALKNCEQNVLESSIAAAIRSSAESRLSALQRQLRASNRIDEAIDVLLLLAAFDVLAGRVLTEELEAYLHLESTELHHVGDVRFRLGREYMVQDRSDWLVQFDLAEATYHQCKHALGLHELSVFRSSFQSWNTGHILKAFDAFIECDGYVKLAGIARIVMLQSNISNKAVEVLAQLILDIRSWALPSLDSLSLTFEAMIERGSQLNAIVETCESLLAGFHGASDHTVHARFLLSGLLSMAFEKLYHAAKATYYANLHLTESEQFFGYDETVSDFASTYARLSRLHILQLESMSERKAALDDLRCRLTAWVAQDLEAGYLIHAYDKQTRIWDLLRLEAHFNPTIQVIADPFMQELDHIEKRVLDTINGDSWTVLCNICLLRGALYEGIEDYEGSLLAYQKAASILDQHGEDYVQAEVCVALTNLAFKVYTASGRVHDDLLDMADVFIGQAIKAFRQREDLDRLCWCTSWQAELCLARGKRTGERMHFEQGLRHVQDSRQLWEEQRYELSTLSGGQGMETKHAFAVGHFITPISNPTSRDLFDIGIDLALALGDPETLWDFVEGSKARNLAEMLGLTMTVPAKFIHGLAADPLAFALWNEAESLGHRIVDLPLQARRSARAKLSQLRASMRNMPAFHDILSLQNGDPISLAELWNAFQSTIEDKLTFVHWVTHKADPSEGETEILLVVVQVQKQGVTTPHICKIPRDLITLEKVAQWKTEYLDTVSLQDEELMDEVFALLSPLVEPLGTLSSPGDLLVFCPTGVLHSLPLHALTVTGQILLHRNPIIYSHSISILRQCSTRAAYCARRGILQDAVIFGNPTGDRLQSEESVKELRLALGITTMVVGSDATADRFVQASRQASLVHYHGHASGITGDPFEQSLLFSDKLLTARDVLNLNFEHAPHLTLIACASAEQRISTSNEPLGILPAFLAAGAPSIVGTLWPLRDMDGARFSKAFYRPFTQETPSRNVDSAFSQIVNLATTLQHASLSIREQQGTRAPYYWAAFVLHGAWFLQLS